jgi:hypothetical protein
MFIEHSTKVDVGLAEVENTIEMMRSEFESWADVAYREGEQLRSRVGPTPALAREVKLVIGMAEIQSSGLVYPVHWTAQSASLLFPELDADLILSKIDRHRTSLTLKGTYRPPLGPLGRLADRAVLRHLAEATISNWMGRLAAALSPDTQTV